MTVYKKIAAVTAALSASGVSKDQRNEFDKYNFRGIDDVYNALAPLLAEHGLVILPHVVTSEARQIQTSQGKPANHVRVMVDYNFVDADSDSTAVVRMCGEASDRGDKGENKAMSAAYKLMAFQTFCIPVEGQDSEQDSIEHGVSTVAPGELVELRRMLSETNTDEQAFCDWQKIDNLEAMHLDRFAAAMDALNRKSSRLAQEYARQQESAAQMEDAQGVPDQN